MANIKSSIKRARQNVNRRAQNSYYRTTARTYVKRVRAQILANDVDAAQETMEKAIKAIDKAAQKGVMHRNTAARRKSRLVKALNKVRRTAA